MKGKQTCIKGTREAAFFHCSCDDCARAAAATWMGYMDLVMDGSISLTEANTLADAQWGRA